MCFINVHLTSISVIFLQKLYPIKIYLYSYKLNLLLSYNSLTQALVSAVLSVVSVSVNLLLLYSLFSVSFSTVKQLPGQVLPPCGTTDYCKTSMCMFNLRIQSFSFGSQRRQSHFFTPRPPFFSLLASFVSSHLLRDSLCTALQTRRLWI